VKQTVMQTWPLIHCFKIKVWRNKHFTQKSLLHRPYKKSHDRLYTAASNKSCRSKMPYIIAVGQSLMAGVLVSIVKTGLQQFDIC